MIEKISAKMVPHTFGVVTNVDKALLVSTDSQSEHFRYENSICVELGSLTPNRQYNCTGSMHFNGRSVSNQSLTIVTDYGGKWNAYFCFKFCVFLGTPTVKPIIWVSWG